MEAVINPPAFTSDAVQVLTNSFLTLEFRNGHWCGLFQAVYPQLNLIRRPAVLPVEVRIKKPPAPDETTNYGLPGVQSQKHNISEGGIWPVSSGECRFRGYRRTGNSLATYFSTPMFDFEVLYRLRDRIIEREISLSYKGDDAYLLYEFVLNSPEFGWENPDGLEFSVYDLRNNLGNLRRTLGRPVYYPGDRCPGKNHQYTAMDCDMSHEVSMLLGDALRRFSLVIWGYSTESEAVSYSCGENDEAISFNQSYFSFIRLKESPRLACRRQVIMIPRGPRERAVRKLSLLKKAYGWTAPSPDEFLRTAVIYQVHGFISDFGGFKGLSDYLETLAELGVNIIYLPPLAPPEAYLNYKPDSVAPCYGTAQEFRQLVAKAHHYGMKVIVDMIAHHIFRQSPIAQIPEFVRYDECLAPLSYSIGAVLTATGNPEYQKYYIACCRKLVESYDIDGFRFDVAGFQLPDWNHPYPGSTVLAQTTLLRKLKSEMDPVKPLIYLEEGMGVNGFRYVTHGWIHLLKKLKFPELREDIPLSCFLRQLKPIFEDSALKNRPYVMTMYHAKIHDTVLMQNFGRETSPVDRAIMALILVSDGVPLITQGAECGCFDWLKKMIRLKQHFPAVLNSKMQIDVINDSIVQVRRQNQESTLKCLINFSAEPQTLQIDGGPTPYLLCSSAGSEINYLQPFGCVVLGSEPVSFEDSKHFFCTDGAPRIEWRLIGKASQSENDQSSNDADEGSFSGIYQAGDSADERNEKEETDWLNPDFDDSSWNKPFVPRTRQPYNQNGSTDYYPYIEDVADDAWDILWTRMPALRSGTAKFRLRFTLDRLPEQAVLDFASPAFYDFDLAVANGGIDEKLLFAENPLKIRLNGNPVMNGDVPPELFTAGENILTVEAVRGHGTHGFGGRFLIDDRVIAADENWLCAPFTYLVPSADMIRQVAQPDGTVKYRTIPPPGYEIQFRLMVAASSWQAGDYRGITGRGPQIRNAYSGARLPVWSSAGTRHTGRLEISAGNICLDMDDVSGCAIYDNADSITLVTSSPEFTVSGL